MQLKEALSLDDILLQPKYSTISTRSQIDTSVQMGDLRFAHPIVPANMKSIIGYDMAKAVLESGGLCILHRFSPIEDQLNLVKRLNKEGYVGKFGVSIGVKNYDRENVIKFSDCGVNIFCIDIAHGHSYHCQEMINYIKSYNYQLFIIAGNVCTKEGALDLFKAGANCVKINIGAGSTCTTRTATGNGIPQFTALCEAQEGKQDAISWLRSRSDYRQIYIMSDGGCKNSGDLVKSLALSDLIMTGHLMSGLDQNPGTIIEKDGVMYKEYNGSSTLKSSHIEGVKAMVKYKGSYQAVLEELLQGIRSGASYQGVKSIKDLQKDPIFVKITNAGIRESGHHDVKLQ